MSETSEFIPSQEDINKIFEKYEDYVPEVLRSYPVYVPTPIFCGSKVISID